VPNGGRGVCRRADNLFLMASSTSTVDTVVSLCKRRGFVFPCGEIYGGTRSAWDYGPLGVELKENIKRQWWKAMVHAREDVVGLDSSIILPRQVWVASGHVGTFTDPLVECLSCHKRERADHLQEAYAAKKSTAAAPMNPDDVPMSDVPARTAATAASGPSPRLQHDAQDLPRRHRGRERLHYLRPETAQGIFVNFKNVMRARRARSRRSASPRSARASATRSPRATSSSAPASSSRWRWSSSSCRAPTRSGTSTGSTSAPAGTSTSASRPTTCATYEHPKEKLSHYSKRTVDIEYRFNFTGSEWGELEGIANRTDFDLSSHSQHSGQDLSYFDQATGERFTPYVIEPAAGLSRSLMTFLVDAYAEDEAPNTKGGVDKRVVLRLDPRLAPVKAAVLPLSRNADLSPKARDLAATLRRNWNVEFDDAGAIGKRYRRQDEIGTPYCITVDFDTLEDTSVSRDRIDHVEARHVGADGRPGAESEGWRSHRPGEGGHGAPLSLAAMAAKLSQLGRHR
jgi:glycyl-tRNA synthetase